MNTAGFLTFGLIIGFLLLIWSAHKFTDSGVKIAHIFHISPLLVGILIFGFGTSVPEMLVSALAAYTGNVDLGVGNAIGSNILNIALVLGVSAVITPIKVEKNILKKWIALISSALISWWLLLDGYISRLDGIILLLALIIFLITISQKSKVADSAKPHAELLKAPLSSKQKTWLVYLQLIIALSVLVISAELIVFTGASLARLLHISDLVIGLSIIAFGTSLPELAVSISASLKKQHSMLIGNIIGSNLFNTLAVLAMPGIIHPSIIDKTLLSRDYPIMFMLTILLFLVSYKFYRRYIISRLEGVLLLLVFLYYLNTLF